MIPHKVCNNLCISHSSTPPPRQKKKFHSDLLRPINSSSSLLIETLTLGNLMVAGRGSRVAGPMSRSRVQSRGQGSNVAAGESDLGFEVTEWKRLIWKKYKGKKNRFYARYSTRVAEGARRERHEKRENGLPPSFLTSRGFAAQRSRACPPLTKSEEKERLLAVYIVFIVIIYSFFESTQVVELPRDVFASLTKVTYLWVLLCSATELFV